MRNIAICLFYNIEMVSGQLNLMKRIRYCDQTKTFGIAQIIPRQLLVKSSMFRDTSSSTFASLINVAYYYDIFKEVI